MKLTFKISLITQRPAETSCVSEWSLTPNPTQYIGHFGGGMHKGKKNNVISGFIRSLVLNTLIFIDVTVVVVHCSLLCANDYDFVV